MHRRVHKACLYLSTSMFVSAGIQVFAADWASIIQEKESEILVDMDSYNEKNGIPYINTKTIYLKSQNHVKNAQNLKYSESHSTSQFNCATQTYKKNSIRLYDSNKKLLLSENGDALFKPIVAGSKDAQIGRLVCQVHKMVGGH